MEEKKDPSNKIGYVIKRNGARVEFDGEKIALAIKKAFDSIRDQDNDINVNDVYNKVINKINDQNVNSIRIEKIQDIIEETLDTNSFNDVYIAFKTYRDKRNKSREVFEEEKKRHKFQSVVDNILDDIEKASEIKENKSEKYGNMIVKQIAETYLIKRKVAYEIYNGSIFADNLETYLEGSVKSSIVSLEDVFKGGFNFYGVKYHEPRNISSYLSIASIVGDSLKRKKINPTFIDFNKNLADILIKNFKEKFRKNIYSLLEFTDFINFVAINSIDREIAKLETIFVDYSIFQKYIRESEKIYDLIKFAGDTALKEVFLLLRKGVEGFVRNLSLNCKEKNINNYVGIDIISGETKEETLTAIFLLRELNKYYSESSKICEKVDSNINIYVHISYEELLKLEQKFIDKNNVINIDLESIYDEVNSFKDLKLSNFQKTLNNYYEKINYTNFLIYVLKTLDSKYVANKKKSKIQNDNTKFRNIHFVLCDKRYDSINKYSKDGEKFDRDFQALKEIKEEFVTSRGILSSVIINLVKIANRIKKENSNISVEKMKKLFYLEIEKEFEISTIYLLDRFNRQCEVLSPIKDFIFETGIWNIKEPLKEGERLRKLLKHSNLNLGVSGLYESILLIFGENYEKDKLFKELQKLASFLRKECDRFQEEKNVNLKLFLDKKKGAYFYEIDKALYGENPLVYGKYIEEVFPNDYLKEKEFYKYFNGGFSLKIRQKSILDNIQILKDVYKKEGILVDFFMEEN